MDPQDTSVALVLTLVLSLLKFGSGQWQVIGPEKMVQVLVGEDAVFSCSLAPKTNAEAMEVRFFRDQFSAVIHLYRDGKDQNDIQIPDYRGRTELLKDSLGNGRVSLRLKKVTLSDAGLYGCWFKSRTYEQNTSWDMQVSALGSAPLISMIGYFHGGIQLLCKSSGWFPKPIVKWKNSHEHNLPSDTKVNTDKHGLFDVETSFTIQENSGSISCSVQLTNNSQELESRIWIGDTFFQPIFQRLVFISLGVLCSVLFVYIIFHSIFKDQRKHHGQAELREVKKHAVQVTLGTDTSGSDSGHRHCSPVEVTLDTGTSGDDFGHKHGSPVEVTLDTDMAHPQLYISGLKSVIYRKTLKVMPYLEKRFNSMCVVAIQCFRAGKHYWEVDVGHNERWYLGVCRDDVDREEENVTLSPNNGYWVLGGERDQYFTLYPHRISLCLGFPPTRVGVFLDYEGGTISFYNTNDQSFICTLTHQFEGLLRPYIWHQKLDEEM